jgi:uncharacterized membrane protein YhhN
VAALAFLVTAISLEPTHSDTRVWFCVALGFCVLGDVFLMLPSDAFVVAQVCFTIGFSLHLTSGLQLVLGIVLVVVIAAPLGTRFVRAIRRDGRGSLVVPVLAYVVAIGAMVAAAIGAGGAAAIAGAGLFFVSDALIGETRFVRPWPWGPVAVIVTYHLALAGLVFSLVR